MKAEITITGVCSYGRMFETQATIILENGQKLCKQWSLHGTLEDAKDYQERFNKE